MPIGSRERAILSDITMLKGPSQKFSGVGKMENGKGEDGIIGEVT